MNIARGASDVVFRVSSISLRPQASRNGNLLFGTLSTNSQGCSPRTRHCIRFPRSISAQPAIGVLYTYYNMDSVHWVHSRVVWDPTVRSLPKKKKNKTKKNLLACLKNTNPKHPHAKYPASDDLAAPRKFVANSKQSDRIRR